MLQKKGRIPIEGQGTRRMRRKVLQNSCRRRENGRETSKQRKFKELEGSERFRKNGLDLHRTSREKGWNKPEEGRER